MVKRKRTKVQTNDLQNTTQKIRLRKANPTKTGVNLSHLERLAVSAPQKVSLNSSLSRLQFILTGEDVDANENIIIYMGK